MAEIPSSAHRRPYHPEAIPEHGYDRHDRRIAQMDADDTTISTPGSPGANTSSWRAIMSALAETEHGYRTLLEAMPAAVYTCDREGRIAFFNPAAAALWGREPVLGEDKWCGWWRIYRPDGSPLPLEECPMAMALRERRPVRGVEIVVECRDGSRRNVLPHPEPILDASGQVLGALNVLVDVTEAKRAGQTRALLAAIVDSTDDGVISMSLEGVITSFNAAAERLFGYTRDEVVGGSILRLIPPERHGEESGLLARLRNGEKIEHFETVRLGRDGRRLDVSLTLSPVRDGQGIIIGASKIVRDIGERLRAERARQESERRFGAMFGQAAVGIVLLDRRGRVLESNARTSQITGRSPDELRSLTVEDLVHPDDRASAGSMLADVVAGARSEFALETRFERADGTFVWVNVTCSPLLDQQGGVQGLMAVIEDVGACKQAEQEVRHHREHLEQLVQERTAELRATHERLRLADRLASIGTLAVGLGHDIGNLLLPLRMRIEALDSLGLPTAAQDELAGIRTSAEYLTRLANGLRMMVSEPDSANAPDVVEVHAWWNDAYPLLRNAAAPPIQILPQLPDGECWIGIATASLTQIVFNLVQNAGNAMKSRGSGAIQIMAELSDSWVRLCVRDDGPGMTEEVRRRCMEPFFTTSPRSISTGLGLFLVYGLIKQAGGFVVLDSEPGRGTSFQITLPIVRPPSSGTPSTAVVSIRDPRLRALVAAELVRLDFGLGEDPAAAACAMLITDERDKETLQQMTEEYPGCRIGLLGEAPSDGLGAKFFASGPTPTSTSVRQFVKSLARSERDLDRRAMAGNGGSSPLAGLPTHTAGIISESQALEDR